MLPISTAETQARLLIKPHVTMLPDVSKFVVRNPRHLIATGSESSVEIHRAAGRDPENVPGMLVDFSRSGLQVQIDARFDEGEEVTVRLHRPDSEFELLMSGKVRWQRTTSNGSHSVGCEFDEEVSWESLGELFLNGILSMD